MGKVKTIILVIFLLLILAIAGVVYVGYSFTKVQVAVGDPQITHHITQDNLQVPPTYKGYILIETNVSIYNGAVLSIENLNVNIEVYFIGSILSKTLVGEGKNPLGDIKPGENNTYIIKVNVTENIPILAVDDGTFEIHIYTTLNIQFVPKQISFTKVTTAPWNAPF